MAKFLSTKLIELGSTAFRQPNASSHCKQVHGYLLKAKVWLGCNELDENNWVFDFGGFKELKKTLEKTYDHKLVLSKDDPARSVFKELERYGAASIVTMDGVGIEKFAEHVFNEVDTYVKFATKNRVWCEKVEVFEHEKNSAIYQKEEKREVVEEKPVEVKKDTEQPEQSSPEPAPAAPLHNPVTPVTPESKPSGPTPASFGNKVTTGWSNPFGGTSWGS